MNKNIIAAGAAALLLAGLTGCVGTAGGVQPGSTNNASNDTLTTPSFAPEPSAEPEPSGNLAFGEAMTWKNGLAVSVSAPVEFTPSEYAAGGNLAYNVVFNVTVTNGSNENYDGYVYMTMTSGGAAGEQVFDVSNSLEGPPSGLILPGQSITFASGWNVADPAALVLTVEPGFEYQKAIFTNVAG